MKNILLAIAATTSLLAGCTKDNDRGLLDAPIAFQATFEEPMIVMGTSSQTYTWVEDTPVGVFVEATREMPFRAAQSASSTLLSPLSADIPSYYGKKAYAYTPALTTGEVYFKASLKVPSMQVFERGYNPNALSMAAIATVEDGAAEFKFRQLGAVLELGLHSPDADVVLSKMKIEVLNPSAGKYIAGSSKIDFTGSVPSLAEAISGGSNSIVVEFAEPIQLTTTPIYIPIGVLPFSSDSKGLQVTVYDADNNICTLPAIWTDNNAISENGALTVGRGERVIDLLDEILYANFDRPELVTIEIVDNKDGKVRPNAEIEVYTTEGATQIMVGAFTADANGKVKLPLNPGAYVAYCAYNTQTDAKWNQLDFTVVSRGVNTFKFEIFPMLYVEDFDWITPEMGGGVVLKSLYESINPPVANTANEVAWGSGVGVSEILAQKGLTFTTWVYIRPGSARVGKKSASGTITTPKLNAITGSTIKFSVVALPWHVVANGAWKLEDAVLVFKITGSGSFSASETDTSYTTAPMTSDAPTSPLKKNIFELPIYNAAADTQISVTNALPAGVSTTMYRVMIDQITVMEVR